MVYGVPGAIEQILDNLISNALDAVPDDTEVVVRAHPTAEVVDLHVIDQGPGMDADTRAHAFERFWRPDAGSSSASDGFGLGLAIVARLAARSGGAARLEPAPGGVGLDVVVTLRLADARFGVPSGDGPGRDGRNLYPTLTSD